MLYLSTGLALAIALNQVWWLGLPSWLLFPLLAGAVMTTGLLYPYASGDTNGDAPDISEIMRCVAVFVGIFQASTVSSHMIVNVVCRVITVSQYHNRHSLTCGGVVLRSYVRTCL